MSFTFCPGSFRGPHAHVGHYKSVTGKVFDWKITQQLLAYLKPYKRQMVEGVLLMLAGAGIALVVPYLIKTAIDEHIAAGNMAGLSRLALVILVAYILDFASGWRRRWLLNTVGNNVLRTMRSQLFSHYQVLSMRYYDVNGSGSLISRMLSDVGVINELLSQGLINMISDVVVLITTVAVMLIINARLALLTFLVLPPMIVATLMFAGRARLAYRRTREKVSILTGRLAEDLGAMRVIQAFSEEDRTSRDFDEINRENRDAHVAAVTLDSIFPPTMEAFSMIAI